MPVVAILATRELEPALTASTTHVYSCSQQKSHSTSTSTQVIIVNSECSK